ncbi:MAG: PhoH family protein [Caldiserica bacterium]|nr:MAG: PhoH family protein [Caldisericota bacterium]
MKTFVLDTNVLIHDPRAIYNFKDNVVVLPITVIEELDNLKRLHDERGRNARFVTRELDSLRRKGDITKGVELENGGILRIELKTKKETLPEGFLSKADNLIISTALYLKSKGENVIFISKDMNMRVKAESLGLKVEDYEKEKIDFGRFYYGYREILIEDEKIDRFYKQKKIKIEEEFYPNEFVILKGKSNPKKSAIGRYSKKDDLILSLMYDNEKPWGIRARNVEQRFAFEALLDDKILLVTLVGIAGTGKTLLALACGLKKVFDENAFRKLFIARPVIPVGRDIGYLPGTKEEKLSPWMGAIYDNLEFLLEVSGEKERIGKDEKMYDLESAIEYLFSTGKIEIEALTYIRGRSIPEQFIIIDEAQNLTPREVKTIISRAGEGTKVVLTGDPYQIDNPYLDAESNGLTYCVEKFKGEEIFAQVYFTKSERSKLASLAAEIL